MAIGRIYYGSPQKVRALQTGAPREVTCEERLGPDEVFITHRRLFDEVQELAALGVKSVLVSEALEKLGEEVNPIFLSISGLAENREDLQIILENVKSEQGKGSFSGFAFGLRAGLKGGDQVVIEAIERRGFQTFKDVLIAVAEDDKENSALAWLAGDDPETETMALMAWAKAFVLLEERHKKSHPFNFIGGDVELAEEAVQVLAHIGKAKQGDDVDVLHLIQAAVPLLKRRVDAKKAMAAKLKADEQADREDICKKLSRMRRQSAVQRAADVNTDPIQNL